MFLKFSVMTWLMSSSTLFPVRSRITCAATFELLFDVEAWNMLCLVSDLAPLLNFVQPYTCSVNYWIWLVNVVALFFDWLLKTWPKKVLTNVWKCETYFKVAISYITPPTSDRCLLIMWTMDNSRIWYYSGLIGAWPDRETDTLLQL